MEAERQRVHSKYPFLQNKQELQCNNAFQEQRPCVLLDSNRTNNFTECHIQNCPLQIIQFKIQKCVTYKNNIFSFIYFYYFETFPQGQQNYLG